MVPQPPITPSKTTGTPSGRNRNHGTGLLLGSAKVPPLTCGGAKGAAPSSFGAGTVAWETPHTTS